ncbi:MAG: hypothetical protein JXA33_19480 [Anaerolineae bacterium]|nr:hypothetical protein [Anaerolineae bacterium]
MMDHVKILKRAWHILWSYRALWIFGIILALTTASGGGGSSGAGGRSGGNNGISLDPSGQIPGDFDTFARGFTERIAEIVPVLIGLGIALGCSLIFLAIIGQIARYVAETALIRMVDDYEETGTELTMQQGFRLGWSRKAWQLFLINLLIDLPVVLVFIVLFLLSGTPLFMWVFEQKALGVLGTISAIGLFFLVIFLAIVVGVVISLLKHFFHRACVLEDLDVMASIRRGYVLVRQNLKDAGLMWLVMVGVGIAWGIVMIPVVLLAVLIGAIVGGGVGLLVRGLAGFFFSGAVPWVFAAVVGGPLFLLLMVIPLAFVSGLRETFKSTTWTLTYREICALENLKSRNSSVEELEISPVE